INARRGPPAPTRVMSPATFAYIVQLIVMYFFAAAWKWTPEWHTDATAAYLALEIETFTTRLGLLMKHSPALLAVMTRYTMLLETIGPVVLLLPFDVGLQRLIVVSLFVTFHLGLGLSMELGRFPITCMVAWLPLLPGGLWDRLAACPQARPPF